MVIALQEERIRGPLSMLTTDRSLAFRDNRSDASLDPDRRSNAGEAIGGEAIEGKGDTNEELPMQMPPDASDRVAAPDSQSRQQQMHGDSTAAGVADSSTVDAETERLLKEYLEQTERLADARNADRGRQSEAVKAKLAAR